MKFLTIIFCVFLTMASNCQEQKAIIEDNPNGVKVNQNQQNQVDKVNNNKEKQNTLIEKYLIGSWLEAVEDEEGKIVDARPRRGGLFALEFPEKNIIYFKLPPSCGFGHSRMGTFTVDQATETLNCHFTQTKGYFNSTEPDKEIDQKESFKILKLEEKGMIIQAMDETEKIWVFKKKSNQ